MARFKIFVILLTLLFASFGCAAKRTGPAPTTRMSCADLALRRAIPADCACRDRQVREVGMWSRWTTTRTVGELNCPSAQPSATTTSWAEREAESRARIAETQARAWAEVQRQMAAGQAEAERIVASQKPSFDESRRSTASGGNTPPAIQRPVVVTPPKPAAASSETGTRSLARVMAETRFAIAQVRRFCDPGPEQSGLACFPWRRKLELLKLELKKMKLP